MEWPAHPPLEGGGGGGVSLITLSREKSFQVLKVHLGMGRIRGLRGEEIAIFGLIMYFCKNLGKRPSFG